MTSEQLIGRTLAGRFRITGFIGDGAMATVYRGVQDGDPPEVAIKVLRPDLVGDRTFVGRFRREAKAASRLHHANTVQIVHYGVDDGLFFIVMELIAGQDLFELLTLERRLSEARAASVLVQICEALIAAHAQGIVHRDLKPENIMLVPDAALPSGERVKVLDFGIAKIVDAGAKDPDAPPNSSLASSVVTRVGIVVGTPAYMSPEQCRGEAVDARTDIYACGVLLFQLVTGRLPFYAETPFEFALKHVQEPPPAPSTLLPGIHPGLEATILMALAKWPVQRHQSAAELGSELRHLLPELASSGGAAPALPRGTPAGSSPTLGAMQTTDPMGTALELQPTQPSGTATPFPPAAAIVHQPALPTPWPSAPPPGSLGPPPSTHALRTASGSAWILVPIAIAIGIGLGAVLFFVTR